MSNKLSILFLTYNRMQYAEPCLYALLNNISFSGEIHVHIADDGSPGDYRDRLRRIAGGYIKVHSAGSSNSEHRGYGANYNLATQHIHCSADYVLCVEDDWLLNRQLDIDALTGIFRADSSIGCIRLGYLGVTQKLLAELKYINGDPLWMLDPDSFEPHVWAGHPRLETVAWQKQQGPWAEGVDPNMTEFIMAHHIREGIAWPGWLNPKGGDLFSHIGSERAR